MTRRKHSILETTYAVTPWLPDVASQRARGAGTRANIAQVADTADTYEAARRQRAERLGCAYLPPTPVVEYVPPVEAINEASEQFGYLKCDPELGRICTGLRQSAQLRLHLVISQHARETGFNYIDRADLMALLERYGIKHTRHNLNRWLHAGQGVFWRLTTFGRIYLVSYEKMAVALAIKAATHDLPDLRDLVATNIPGQSKAMYVKVQSDTVQQFEAQLFAAWHASRNNPQISRWSLQRLFNRDTKTMIEWQRIAGITVLHSIVHYTEEFSHDVPSTPEGGHRGDVLEYEVNGRKRWSAEYSNSYQTPTIRQHPKRGAFKRVFAVIREALQSDELTNLMREKTTLKRRRPGEIARTAKYLYQDRKRARASAKYDKPDKPKARAIFKGVDNRRCAHFEHSPDGHERTRFKACTLASVTLERKTHKCLDAVYSPPF